MLQLKAEKREATGKQVASIRKEGKMPAVLYGKGVQNTPVSVSLVDFRKVWKEAGESTVVELDLNDGGKAQKENIIIHDVSLDPVSAQPTHADFLWVDMNKTIIVSIPLVFEGVAGAVKTMGGVLVKVMHEIEIETLPKNIPHELTVDISKLATFEDQITIEDIKFPDGVKVLAKEGEVVALVERPREEAVEEPTMTLADIEVEKKGKEEKGEEAPNE